MKPRLVLHVGLPGPTSTALHDALHARRAALTSYAVLVATGSRAEALRASVELTRTHRAHGLRRSEVEGTWAQVVRRTCRELTGLGRGPIPEHGPTAVLSLPLLSTADSEQIALTRDALAGFDLRVLVTVEESDGAAALAHADQVVAAWTAPSRVGRVLPDHAHVLAAPSMTGTPLAPLVWRAVAALSGFSASEVELPTGALTAPAMAYMS